MRYKFEAFAALHVAGDPLILYNAWDVGSARAVADAGAKAIATGSWSVAAAQGYDDGEHLPLDLALANAARIAGAVALPVTIDFEGGYAASTEPLGEHLRQLAATGAIGCNLEDRDPAGGLHGVAAQAQRIAAARRGAGEDFFLNARTDLFLDTPLDRHDDALADAAIARGQAYAAAGANGFFVPGLADLALIERICAAVPLPVNVMAFAGAAPSHELADCGVARISYGPNPYRAAMDAVRAAAQQAFAWEAAAPLTRPRRRARNTARPALTA